MIYLFIVSTSKQLPLLVSIFTSYGNNHGLWGSELPLANKVAEKEPSVCIYFVVSPVSLV